MVLSRSNADRTLRLVFDLRLMISLVHPNTSYCYSINIRALDPGLAWLPFTVTCNDVADRLTQNLTLTVCSDPVFLSALYFVFITLTTIGYGDLSPGQKRDFQWGNVNFLLEFLLMFIMLLGGLVLMSFFISCMMESFERGSLKVN